MGVPGILVTDAQDRPALAAVRCLAAAGYRVSATANTRLAPGLWSHGCSAAHVLPDPSAGVDEFVARLKELLVHNPQDLLLPGTDETLYAVSGRRQRIEPHVQIGLPSVEAVERALDKQCLSREAERVGLASPEQCVCDELDQARDAARAFGFPVVVKGVRAVAEVDGKLVRHPSRLALDDQQLVQAQHDIGRCIVQRHTTGSVISFGGVATDGGMLGAVVSRYRRTWPPKAGSVSFSETIVAPGKLSEQVTALVTAIGWTGTFELELMERENGALQAIDFNPRLYGSLTLARAAGAPLASLWCRWLLGEDPAPARARPGVHYRWEDADARNVLWQLRRGDYLSAALAARPRRGATHAYFQARDPLPLAIHGLELVRQRWRRARAGR